MKLHINKAIRYLLGLALVLFGSCTDLHEDLYGRLSPQNYYNNESEVLSALVNVYSGIGYPIDGGNAYRTLELGTDEFAIPSRSDGRWYDGGVWLELARHEWTALNSRIASSWSSAFSVIGRANSFIESVNNSPNKDDYQAEIAEARLLRAYSYFFAMDLWGNVPLVTVARQNPQDLPTNSSSKEVFDFVTTELTEAAADLPSINEVDRTSYYGRVTRETAYAILAIVYLNAEVYTGQSYWQQCIDMCDSVIDSKGYQLAEPFVNNFVADNDKSPEFILVRTIDPTQNAGGNSFVIKCLHDSHRFKYNLPFTPQNGFTTTEIAFNRYEDGDDRRDMILHGPQYDANGQPLPTISGSGNLVLTPIQNLANAAENEGYRELKWQPDPNWVGSNGHNDLCIIRYAEILLTKAEALLRSGGSTTEALNLVNEVRLRSHASKLTSVTLNTIYDERGREFLFEGQRRRDMIRFGTYTTWTWKFKPNPDPDYRALFPIPQVELNANANLKQNPGYN